MNTKLYALVLGLAQKNDLRDATRILIDRGFSVAEANELVAEADRQIETSLMPGPVSRAGPRASPGRGRLRRAPIRYGSGKWPLTRREI